MGRKLVKLRKMMRKLLNSMECFCHLAPLRRGLGSTAFVPLLLRSCSTIAPEKVLPFANPALYEDPEKPSLSSMLKRRRFTDTIGYLNWYENVLVSLKSAAKEYYPVRTEALGKLRTSLRNQELKFEEDSIELGKANYDLAEAYVAVLDFKEALPFCLKALEIHKKQLGHNAVQVAHDLKLVGIVYSGLGKHDKALEHNVLARRIFKTWDLNNDLLLAEIDAANMMFALGSHNEAVGILKVVMQQTGKDSEARALVLISMAKLLCKQERIAHCRACLESSLSILYKRERISPVKVAKAYADISIQYETVYEIQTAILLLKKALALLERHPHEQHSQGSVAARLGRLLLLTGKVQLAVFYLESAAKRFKDCLGIDHVGLGYVHNNLGVAYLELGRTQLAVQSFIDARRVICNIGGACTADGTEVWQNHAKALAKMRGYDVAVKFQQMVIDAWERLGASAEDELGESRRLLEQLKEKALGAYAGELHLKVLPLPIKAGASLSMGNI